MRFLVCTPEAITLRKTVQETTVLMGTPSMQKQSSADKVLKVLDLFTEDAPAWTVEMLMTELGATRATTYRYLKALYDAGLLAPGAGSSYVLGPRIIQLDRQIRRSDPLLQIAVPLLEDERSPLIGAKNISSLYGDQVLSVYVERCDPDIVLTMQRGRVFPLVYGSPSRIILAYLPPYQMKNFYTANAEEVARAHLGDTWEEFRTSMRRLRKHGHCIGNEMNRTVVGISAPIFHDKSAVSASLSYVRRVEFTSDEQKAELVDLVMTAADRISKQLLSYKPENGAKGPVFTTPRMSG
ncbi:MAG: IclR family transcriptional regulator [Pseudooceanicola sp.]|jgi:DNA-binding IclR family transcriptional regulator|nr:IclR family transcriptional regulator [Pseudooceanicola sp.]